MGKIDDLERRLEEGQANLRKLKAERRKLDKEIRLRIADKAKERNEDWYNHAYQEAKDELNRESEARSRRAKQTYQRKKNKNNDQIHSSNKLINISSSQTASESESVTSAILRPYRDTHYL